MVVSRRLARYTNAAVSHLVKQLHALATRAAGVKLALAHATGDGTGRAQTNQLHMGRVFMHSSLSWHESGTATTSDGKPCAVALAKKQHATFLRSHPVCCVGGTVWQLLQGRECSTDAPYNLLLVDEGSQVPMGQAALGVGLLHPTYSRVVVVGDHLQVSALVCVRAPSVAWLSVFVHADAATVAQRIP